MSRLALDGAEDVQRGVRGTRANINIGEAPARQASHVGKGVMHRPLGRQIIPDSEYRSIQAVQAQGFGCDHPATAQHQAGHKRVSDLAA